MAATPTIKVCVLGDAGVGKSSLIQAIAEGILINPSRSYVVPSVLDTQSVLFTADAMVGTWELGEFAETSANLLLLDTLSSPDYGRLRPLSYPQTDVFLLCYAVNCVRSFENVFATKTERELASHNPAWVDEARHYEPQGSFFLVATKCDLKKHDVSSKSNSKDPFAATGTDGSEILSARRGIEKAKSIDAAGYYETSALSGAGIRGLCCDIVHYVINVNSRRRRANVDRCLLQ